MLSLSLLLSFPLHLVVRIRRRHSLRDRWAATQRAPGPGTEGAREQERSGATTQRVPGPNTRARVRSACHISGPRAPSSNPHAISGTACSAQIRPSGQPHRPSACHPIRPCGPPAPIRVPPTHPVGSQLRSACHASSPARSRSGGNPTPDFGVYICIYICISKNA